MANRPVVFAVTSDQHVGSSVALRPPEKVRLPDGDYNEPSAVQRLLWERWEDYWLRVRAVRDEHDSELCAVFNGDLFDGTKYQTQIVSAHPEPAAYIAARVFGGDVERGSPVTDAKPDRVIVIRGTEAHSGPVGATEEGFARSIHAEPDPSGTWSRWFWRVEVHGIRLDFRHHPATSGRLPHTRGPGVVRLANIIWQERALVGEPYPHIACRGHVHQPGDSGNLYPTRAIITPPWKLTDAYAHKVVPESTPFCGGAIITVFPDQPPEVEMKLYYPEPGGFEPWDR